MGILDGLFGTKLAPLDGGSDAARVLAGFDAFAEFMKTANDRVEVVPGSGDLYAYVGRPPKAFGILWFSQTERFDVRSAMERGAITREAAGRLVAELTRIYETFSSAERYEYRSGGHKVIVTPSAEMYEALRRAVTAAMAQE